MREVFNELFGVKYGQYIETDEPEISDIERTNLELCLSACREAVDSIRENNPEMPSIHLGLIGSFEVRTAIDKKDGAYYICISYAAYTVLKNIFMLMLSNPKVFSEIGDTSIEKAKKIRNPNITHFNRLLTQLDESSIFPNCSRRTELAYLLTEFAMIFLVLHEVGHVMNGHLDLKRVIMKGATWSEGRAQISSDNWLNPVLKQVLEFDADCYATQLSLIFVLKKRQSIFSDLLPKHGGPVWVNPIEEYYAFFLDEMQIIKTLCFAIYTLLRLNGADRHDITKLHLYSHPPAGMRNYMIGATIITLLNRIEGKDDAINVLKTIVNRNFSLVEEAFKEISLDGTGGDGWEAIVFAHRNQAHMFRLYESWNDIRPLLEPHAIAELAPLYER